MRPLYLYSERAPFTEDDMLRSHVFFRMNRQALVLLLLSAEDGVAHYGHGKGAFCTPPISVLHIVQNNNDYLKGCANCGGM